MGQLLHQQMPLWPIRSLSMKNCCPSSTHHKISKGFHGGSKEMGFRTFNLCISITDTPMSPNHASSWTEGFLTKIPFFSSFGTYSCGSLGRAQAEAGGCRRDVPKPKSFDQPWVHRLGVFPTFAVRLAEMKPQCI